MAAAGMRFFFLHLCHVGRFNADFEMFSHTDYISALIRPPIYALQGLAALAIKFCCLLSSWFKEANVANNNND